MSVSYIHKKKCKQRKCLGLCGLPHFNTKTIVTDNASNCANYFMNRLGYSYQRKVNVRM